MTRVPGLLASLLLLLFVLPACDSGTDEPEEDLRILFGVSFERLFSDPSAAEIQTTAPSAPFDATAVYKGAFAPGQISWTDAWTAYPGN